MNIGVDSVRALVGIGKQALGAVDRPAPQLGTAAATDFYAFDAAAVAAAAPANGDLRVGFLYGERSSADLTESAFHSAFKRAGIDPIYLPAERTSFRDGQALVDGRPVGRLDAVMNRYCFDIAGAEMDRMQAAGIPLMNDTTAISTTASKINSELVMGEHGVPRIETRWVMGGGDARSVADEADASLAGLPDKVVVKPFDGESGRGVTFLDNHADARAHILRHFETPGAPALSVQPKVEGARVRWALGDAPGRKLSPEEIAAGATASDVVESAMDYRVMMTRNEAGEPIVVAVGQRIGAPGSDKSNVDSGGWGRALDPDEVPLGIIEAARSAFDSLPGNPEVIGIDVIPVGRSIEQSIDDHSAEGFLVTEMNSSPGVPDDELGTHFADAIAARTAALAHGARATRQATEGALGLPTGAAAGASLIAQT